MDFFEKIRNHLIQMGNLEGKGIDYPLMWFIYLIICFAGCVIANLFILCSKNGNRIIWLSDQHKRIKSKFSYMSMLACTFTGVFLVGSYPLELQNTFGTWNADFFYTIGQSAIMLTAGIWGVATYKSKKFTVLNICSIIIGLSTSIPVAANAVLAPFNMNNQVVKIVCILGIIFLFILLAFLSVRFNLLVKYSRINILMFFITALALFSTIGVLTYDDVQLGKVLPFQGMFSKEPWQELVTKPYWWYFEATVVSWSLFCGRFVAFCSNGYSLKQVIKYGSFSLIILTVVWHIVSAATGFTLSFSRGPIIYFFTALTMIAFAVTSLDSATKTLTDDIYRIINKANGQSSNKLKDKLPLLILVLLGLINIIILWTGTSRLFTIITCLIFVPSIIQAIVYVVKFSIGKIDYNETGTITKEEYNKLLEDC